MWFLRTNIEDSKIIIESLLDATSAIDFLKRWQEGRQASDKKFSYSYIAKKAGYASRSFIRELVLGKKKITISSLDRLAKGFQLPKLWIDFFKTFALIDNPSLRQQNEQESILQLSKEKLRDRILGFYCPLNVNADEIYKFPHIPVVYAGLGSTQQGADLKEIQMRTGLSLPEIQHVLDEMVNQQIIVLKSNRFYPKQRHINFTGIKVTDFFRNYYVLQANKSASEAKNHFLSEEKLFLASSISINEKDMAKLKEQLKKVIYDFLDQAEVNDGDKVIQLILGLF